MVRISTCTPGSPSLIAWVASTPFSFGMLMSMTTTSGASLRASRTASSPSPAPRCRSPPVQLRHADAHAHARGGQLAGEPHRLVPVLRLAHHLEIRLRLQDHPDTFANDGVVGGDEDLHFGCGGLRGFGHRSPPDPAYQRRPTPPIAD